MIKNAEQLLERLHRAEAVTVLTGTGVPAESGVPSFHEARTGPWAKYGPLDLATPEAFLRNPRLVWEWYAYRRELAQRAEPGPVHYALVDLEQRYPQFLLITLNIDGLHWRAGSRDLVELHGSLSRSRCFEMGHVVDRWEDVNDPPPPCPQCGGPLRPDVVWIGEGLPERALREARRATEHSEVFLVIGAGTLVKPAATLPKVARRHGAFVVEINPEETPISAAVDLCIRGRAGEILPELVRRITDR